MKSLLATVTLVLTGLAVPTTLAAPAQAADPSFYDTPASLPAANGDVVRQEASTFFLDPLKVVRAPAKATRVMYRSTSRTGTPIAVTGTVLTPTKPWLGNGSRPVVGYAVGTQGLGDQCAPSRQLAAGSEYEGAFISGLLARGYGVVVTDYEGLGTAGVHTYIDRVSQGHAVLDSIRAAQRLPEAGLPDAGPVGITGYSQGGGAAASAAELAASYAPELKIKGTVAGATPADLDIVARNLDGSLYFGFLGYAINGLASSYGLDMAPYLNDRGEQLALALQGECTIETIATHPFVQSRTLTEDGASVIDLLGRPPFAWIQADQKIGVGRRPSAPVMLTHSVLDDVIPYAAGKQLARRWCDQRATVRLETGVAPTHVGGALESYPKSFAFLEARFAGLPVVSNCWRV